MTEIRTPRFRPPFRAAPMLFLLGVFSAFLVSSTAAPYHVATTGDDANAGTEAAPFKTIQKTIGLVKPGDTVLVRAGRHAGVKIDGLHGAAGAPITFRNYPGERVIIDKYLGADTIVILSLKGSSYLTFQGFEVTNSDPIVDKLRKLNLDDPDDLQAFLDSGVRYGSAVRVAPPRPENGVHHHLVFRDMKIYHWLGTGFGGNGNDIQFINNETYDLGRPTSGYGWYFKGDKLLLRGNRIHDCTFGLHMFGFYKKGNSPITNSIFENNVIYNNGGGVWFHKSSSRLSRGGAGFWLGPGDGNIIRNNVIANNRWGYGGLYMHSANTRVLNNTFYDNLFALSSSRTNVTVQNNIFWRNKALHRPKSSNRHVAMPNNLLDVDPLFLNAAAGDFRLQAGSPAIDAGAALAEVPADMEGTPRPEGAGWDVGAYESGGATPRAGSRRPTNEK
ncbi:MAG: right-handed parallel beta-helix repeat-containing protein [Kiritimatiellae bacterium]|nr:right-handed parallel beta-helix repeat-containing protein [Kiritimatiellia bacterium]